MFETATMSDYYHQFLASMSGVGNPNVNQSPQDRTPPVAHPGSLPLGAPPMPNPYQNLGYFTGFPEPAMFNAPKAQRNRRKSAPGLDHIKHRRTRSGCFTCRSRRVKCDETHPICERCKKGKRECIYPEPQGSRPSGSQSTKDGSSASQQTSPDTSHGEEDDEMDHDSKLDTILDEDELDGPPNAPQPPQHQQQPMRAIPPPRRSSTASSLQRLMTGTRHGSETPSVDGNKSSSPSTSTGTASSLTPAAYQFSEPSLLASGLGTEWSHLPQDLRFYMSYFCDNLTHYHYCMVTDSDDFFRTSLPSIAVRNEALLYAVVGFAAYHYTLRDPHGKVQQFLRYYNKSVTLLLGFLKRKEKHNLGTLLTILQLATIEEYLGDWVNLMGHQKAAFEVLTQLFTPQTVMQTPTGRMVLSWYARFDVFVGLMGGFETALPRDWFCSFADYYREQASRDSGNIGWKIEECSARLRLISMEMSLLFGGVVKGEIGRDDFGSEHERLSRELREWKEGWDPALTDPSCAVKDLGGIGRARDASDIVDPFEDGVLWEHPLFPTTVLTCEWHSIVIMHECQANLGSGAQELDENQQPPAALSTHAYAICQIFEAVELWPSSPPGCLIIIQACLAIAALFLPRDDRHHIWIRRKFALLEAMGYVFPLTTRVRMAELFQDQSCVRWWLPDDEGFSPILRSIRAFADDRNATAVTAQTENLREIRHVFAKMQLGRGSIGGSTGTGGADDGSQTGGESDHGNTATSSRSSSSQAKGKDAMTG